MIKAHKPLLLISLVLLISQGLFAQNKKTLAADAAFNSYQYTTAIDIYKKAYSKVKSNRAEKARIAFRMAECYRLTNKSKRAEAGYKRAIRMKYNNKESIVLLRYADALKANGKYDLAREQYDLFLQEKPDDPRGMAGLASCENMAEWIDNPTNHQVENIKKVNSKGDDFAPTFADSYYSSIIFTSSREGATGKDTDDWTGQNFSDLFIAKKDRKGAWSTPVLLEKNEKINTAANEGAPMMDPEFSNLYFTRCGNEKGKTLGCHIYKSKKAGRGWGEPQKVELGGDSASTQGHATISPNGLNIVFSYDHRNNIGGKDLWIATREELSEPFGRPYNMGKIINSFGNEVFPFFRHDTVLYFASNGHPGMGGLDIFRSSLVNDQWQQPVNMKSPINSNADDFGLVIRPDLEAGFFSSTRSGGRGGDDLYYFIEPPLEFSIKGVVKDDRTLQFLEGVVVKMVGTNGSSIEAKTDPKGFYSFAKNQLAENTSYELLIERDNYFNKKARASTVGLTHNEDFELNFNLEPIPDKPIVLPDILYDLGRWELKPQYQDSLQGLIQTLDQNETLVIELASHTDTRDTEERNDILSQRRAQSVVDYLIERGIDPDRLVAKGYGERISRTLESTKKSNGFSFDAGTVLNDEFINGLATKDEKEAAHTLNRRTEFRVLRKDFIPKTTIQLQRPSQVDIVVNPEENSVPFTPGKGDALSAKCIVNGYEMKFTYERLADGLQVSLEQALSLLRSGAISKTDFLGNPDEVLAGGTIAHKAEFTLKEIRIANQQITNIKAKVNHSLEVPMYFGDLILKQFGTYTIDQEKKQIIFK